MHIEQREAKHCLCCDKSQCLNSWRTPTFSFSNKKEATHMCIYLRVVSFFNTSTSMARTFSDSESAAAMPHSAKMSCACRASKWAPPSLLVGGAPPVSHCHHPPLLPSSAADVMASSFEAPSTAGGAPPCITTISCCKLETVTFSSLTSCFAFIRDEDALLACSRALSLSRHALARAAARASCGGGGHEIAHRSRQIPPQRNIKQSGN